jgi:hypothetical protein
MAKDFMVLPPGGRGYLGRGLRAEAQCNVLSAGVNDVGCAGRGMPDCGQKKAPDCSGAFFGRSYQLNSGYVGSLKTFGAFFHGESYRVAFCQSFESVTLDGGKMYEYVFAIFLLDKTKTLAVIEPLHNSVCHSFVLLILPVVIYPHK